MNKQKRENKKRKKYNYNIPFLLLVLLQAKYYCLLDMQMTASSQNSNW